MKEYILYALAVFIPLGALMFFLLRKQGLMYKHITVIVVFSLLVIISFPLAIKAMGWFISLFFYLAFLIVLIWYLLNGPGDSEHQVISEEVILDLMNIKDPSISEIKTIRELLDEADDDANSEKLGDRLVRMGSGLLKKNEYRQEELPFDDGYSDYAYEEDVRGSDLEDRLDYVVVVPADKSNYREKDPRSDGAAGIAYAYESPAQGVRLGYEPDSSVQNRRDDLGSDTSRNSYEKTYVSEEDSYSGTEIRPADPYETDKDVRRMVHAEFLQTDPVQSHKEGPYNLEESLETSDDGFEYNEGDLVTSIEDHKDIDYEESPADSSPSGQHEGYRSQDSDQETIFENAEEIEPEMEPANQELYEETGTGEEGYNESHREQDDYMAYDTNTASIDEIIDRAFAAKFSGGWAVAAYNFEQALYMAENRELRYLLVNELAFIYREEGFYNRAVEILYMYIDLERPVGYELEEVNKQLKYLDLLLVELERMGQPNLPYAQVPRMIRMKADSAL